MNSRNNESCVDKLNTIANMETDELDPVEISPDGRYIRFNEILGRGAFKNVYEGFDQIDGIEVAWNQISIEDAPQSPELLQRLYSEVHLLKTLKHENVIRSYASWVDDKNKTINIITALFTSGSLKQYRNKHKSVHIKAIKNWARQILRGLDYLHTHNPPIIHRDLKCDNIFVNGNRGEVKIGDLGMATIMQQATARSVIGTPEFMAPELYEEEYNELVDIYSFGMCMLELITCEYPYNECKNQAQIYKKVTSGIKPAALRKINDSGVRSFIEKCLVQVSERPTAADLLKDTFLLCEYPADCTALQLSDFTINSVKSDSLSVHSKIVSGVTCESVIEASTTDLKLQRCSERYEFSVEGEHCDDNSISLTLRITDYSGQLQKVQFMFFLNADTAPSIAAEMVESLDLWKGDVDLIAELINASIVKIVPHWGSITTSVDNGVRECCSYDSYGKDASESELTIDGAFEAPFQHVDPLASTCCWDDYAVEKYMGGSSEESSVQNSGTSFPSSWVTASSDMSLSLPSLSPTDKENELPNDLKLELNGINMLYQQQCRELLTMREAAVEDARKKWIMKKICVL